jgi:hypothetical protein
VDEEAVKEIMKMRLIEQTVTLLHDQCRTERDIKAQLPFLTHFTALLCGFTFSEEGRRQIVKMPQVFKFMMFLIDSIKVQPIQDTTFSIMDMSPVNQLFSFILLFVRNSTIDNRVAKVNFLKHEPFLPMVTSLVSSQYQHPLIKCMAASVIWSLVHNHQGIKGALNKQSVI